MQAIIPLVLCAASLVPAWAAAPPPPTSLNLTVISAANNRSIFECWQLQPGFTISSTPGIAGSPIQQLGNLASAAYSVTPPESNGGLHNAPVVQYVVFISGLAHLTLPDSKDEAWVLGGINGLILATDTKDVSVKGHITTYPSDETTVAIAFVTEGGSIPEHKVLHNGGCRPEELIGD